MANNWWDNFLEAIGVKQPIVSPVPDLKRTTPTPKYINPLAETTPTIPPKETELIGQQTEQARKQMPSPTPTLLPLIGRDPRKSTYHPEDVQPALRAIQAASQQTGIQEDLLQDIAMAESSLNPASPGPGGNSTASGLYQFTNPTWQDAMRWYGYSEQDKMDAYRNALAAARMIMDGYLSKWDASKSRWSPYYSSEELAGYYQ